MAAAVTARDTAFDVGMVEALFAPDRRAEEVAHRKLFI
jgi:hypothetical protein